MDMHILRSANRAVYDSIGPHHGNIFLMTCSCADDLLAFLVFSPSEI